MCVCMYVWKHVVEMKIIHAHTQIQLQVHFIICMAYSNFITVIP